MHEMASQRATFFKNLQGEHAPQAPLENQISLVEKFL